MDIRSARLSDASILASLLSAYLTESFPGHSGTSAEILERDVLSGASILRLLLVERRGVPVGFAAWHRVYDLHWGKGGAEIDDLYLVPQYRGNGVALALVAAVCNAAVQEGLVYLHGTSFDRESPVGRFYDRIAVVGHSAQSYCAGRAFRRIAELHGQSPRDMARSLPPKAWNYEP